MPTQPDILATTFISASRQRFAQGLHKIEHCISQLTDEQTWWRLRPEMNSIANIVLHLSGNVGQWIVSGVGGAADVRNRPAEFADASGRPKGELLAILKNVISQADAALASLPADQLAATRRIQGFDTTIAAAVLDTVSHFNGHVQEIIHMTRQQLGEKYKFDFIPHGPEQQSTKGPAI